MTTRPMQKCEAFFLNLPPELIVAIAQELCRLDQYDLMQVSFAFRHILHRIFNDGTLTRESPTQQLQYLLGRAKRAPDWWACDQCLCLHPVDEQDSPLQPRGCPHSNQVVRDPRFPPSTYVFASYGLHHHHIQLALKYHRIGGAEGLYASRLRRLLSTYAYSPSEGLEQQPIFGFHALGVGTYICQPRVADDRFLLSTRLEFTPHAPDLTSRDSTPSFCVCNHQQWIPLRLRILDIYYLLQSRNVHLADEQMKEFRALELSANNALCIGMSMLVTLPDGEINVDCPACPTEIRVRKFINQDGDLHYQVVSWHDFGVEATPPDPGWKLHGFAPTGAGLDPQPRQARPGSIRALWESSEP